MPRHRVDLAASIVSTAVFTLLYACSLWACSEEPPAPYVGGGTDQDRMCAEGSTTIDLADEEEPTTSCPNSGDIELVCIGNWAALCNARGAVVDTTNCRERGEACVARTCDNEDDCDRCLECKPNSVRCGENGERERCADDGSGYEADTPCDESEGLLCDVISGECLDLCGEANDARSYIGCEYWAVFTSNSLLDYQGQTTNAICRPFSFAIVVANAQGIDAHVMVETPDRDVWEATVPPNETVTIELPCSEELGGLQDLATFDPDDPGTFVDPTRYSSLGVPDAHHITSDVPVTVYQFNPLEFQSEDLDGEEIFSYTNDASLLLPASSLTGDYMVMSSATRMDEIESDHFDESLISSTPGFVSILAVADEPTEVEIISSAYTLPSRDGALPALEPGESHTITLERGEVAQILTNRPTNCVGNEADNFPGGLQTYCNVDSDYDLTGTQIHADHPVMVIAGHDCAFLPYNRWACDHLEEAMLPVQSWGKDILVSVSETIACQPRVPNIVRVVASADDTRVTFAPADAHAPVTLDEGEYVTFETDKDVRVAASSAIMVGQYLLGQDYEGRGTSGSFAKGDPSMSIAIPLAQWRDRYSILSPETIPDNYVNIIAHESQVVLVDGRLVTGFTPIPSTTLVSARVPVSGGQHTLESPATFGITVYGYAVYTSYMLPGGLDLNLINSPE